MNSLYESILKNVCIVKRFKKHICKKEMVKIPKALSDYGITTEEIVDFCEAYWDNLIENKKNI